jgi:voltage-gated sodium channel
MSDPADPAQPELRRHAITDPEHIALRPGAPAWQRAAFHVVESPRFQGLVVGVILLNAAILGIETYSAFTEEHLRTFAAIDVTILAFFVVELVLRLAAVGFRLPTFFRSGWNTFDFAVVAVSLIPGLPPQSTLLRLARLLRVARLLRLFPDLRVLLDGLRRAARPAASLVGLTFLLVYLYAIIGWTLFHETAPQYFGDLGESMLTLFTLLTIEGWNGILADLREVSAWAIPYTLSFILIGTFVVLNLVIGVVITSLDEAYSSQRRDAQGEDLTEAIDSVRLALDALESKLSDTPGDPRLLSMGAPRD